MIADAVDYHRADSVRDVREAILDREDNAVVQRIALGRAVEPHGHDRARFFDFQQFGWVRSRSTSGVSHGIYYVLYRIVIQYNDPRRKSIHSSKASSPRKAGTHNHRRSLLRKPSPTLPKREAAEYGSPLSRGRHSGSQYLVHVDLDAVGVSCADADEQVLHQPAVLFGTGFELRYRAKIDRCGIDNLTPGDPVQQLLRTEADAEILDVDDGAVVRLKSVFCLQLGKAVRTDGLEVRAMGQDRARDAGAAHFAAEDRNDPPDTIAEIAGDDRRADFDGEAEDVSGVKRG